jgi:nucleotide-binding universal stress UspA family protein
MYKRILVATDGSPASRFALTEAINLARSCNAAIRAIYVVDAPFWLTGAAYYDPVKLRQAVEDQADAVLEQARAEFRKIGVDGSAHKVEIEHAGEDVAQHIRQAADAWGADVVVLGTHGRRGVQKMLLGSVAERFVRLTARPVLLVRPPAAMA